MISSFAPRPPAQSGSLGFPTMSQQATPPIMAAGQMPPAPTENVPASVAPGPPAQPGVMPPNHGQDKQKDGQDGMHIPGRMDRLGVGDMLRHYLSGGGDMGAFRHGMQDVRQDWAGGGRVGENPLHAGGSGLIDMLRQKLGIASAPPAAVNPGIVPPVPAVAPAIPPIIGS